MSSTAAKSKAKSKTPNFSRWLVVLGAVVLSVGLILFLLIFFPVVSEEVKYQVVTRNQTAKEITPVDNQFGIVIPKIGANAKVIPNVNPYDPKDYQWQLTKGVAHARGTVFPGQVGNVFIFAHSAGDFMEANRFNAVFYLLSKMDKDDEIDLYYKGEKFKYLVTESKYVEASDVSYLTRSDSEKIVTLMTCWPPGTTLKRLIVIGKISS